MGSATYSDIACTDTTVFNSFGTTQAVEVSTVFACVGTTGSDLIAGAGSVGLTANGSCGNPGSGAHVINLQVWDWTLQIFNEDFSCLNGVRSGNTCGDVGTCLTSNC